MATMQIDRDALMEGLKGHFSVGPAMELWEKVKANGAKSILNGSLAELFYVGLATVERLARDTAGVAAEGAKLDAFLDWLDDIVKLPFWLEPFDRKIFKLVVEALIGFLNRQFGHGWLSWLESSFSRPAAMKLPGEPG